MKIRNHPELKLQWPPPWSAWYKAGDPDLQGEDGTLKDIIVERDSNPPHDPNGLTLILEYKGNEFYGLLRSDDPAFIDRFYQKLKAGCTGMALQDIGDVDIP